MDGKVSNTVNNYGKNDDGNNHEKFPKGKRIPRIQQNLAFAVQSLQGIEVVLELKNDDEVRGVVSDCDEKMNIYLKHASLQSHEGKTQKYEEILIKGKFLRYVHFPSFINIRAQAANLLKTMETNKRKYAPRKIVERVRLTEISKKREHDEIILDMFEETNMNSGPN